MCEAAAGYARFIWVATEPATLSPRTRALCQDLDNKLLLSIASIWEIQIKHQLGKLAFVTPLAELITIQREVNRVALLAIEQAHIFALQELPLLHKDPFDRMLIAQANVEGITLLTADGALPGYQVRMLKA